MGKYTLSDYSGIITVFTIPDKVAVFGSRFQNEITLQLCPMSDFFSDNINLFLSLVFHADSCGLIWELSR